MAVTTSSMPLIRVYYNRLFSSNPGPVPSFMLTPADYELFGVCLEGFFYGKISVQVNYYFF